MALHNEPDEPTLERIAAICGREDVLYSYRHALVAFVDGAPAGICLCYDGGRYHALRAVTFPLFDPNAAMDLDHAEDEAYPGEWYVDSLAVFPPFRRLGLGRALLRAQLRQAASQGFARASLLVDPANPGARRLYESVGFFPDPTHPQIYAFGQSFDRLICLL